MSLKDKAMKMNSGKGIEFMHGKEKGEMLELIGKICTIRDYDFINGDDGEYAVFIIDEITDEFFFGGSVLTKDLKEFTEEEHEEVKRDGLPVLFTEQKSKKTKRPYVAVEFYPNNKEENSDDLPF